MYIVKKQMLTKAGKTIEETNEDCVYVCDKFGFVIDGATGLFKENYSPLKSDARWFAQFIKDFLVNNLTKKISLQQILKECVIQVNKKYDSFKDSQNAISRPSAGIALFRVNDDKVEFFVLGDCQIFVKSKSGNIQKLSLNDLPRLDQINISKMTMLAKIRNIDVIDARPLINDDLIATRLTQNTDKGYWILSNSIEAIDNGLYITMPISEIRQIIAMTDGYSQIIDTFHLYTIQQISDLLENGTKLESLYEKLYNAQEKDKECNYYPRFKIRDDASCLEFEL